MLFGSKLFLGSRKGIAEVLGALLLIIVVVVAVAALASFIAQAQTNAQSRESYLSNVKNENLQITYALFNASAAAHSLWYSVLLNVRNTNTADSQLSQVEVGRYWFPHWNQANSTGHVIGQRYGAGNAPLLIPAKGTVTVRLNFTQNGQTVPRGSAVSLTLLTVTGNFFTTVYNPPTAVGQAGLVSVSYPYFNRDVLSLDGSKSQSFNGTQIVSYVWRIEVAKIQHGFPNCTAAAFVNKVYYQNVTVTGEVARFFQEQATPPLLGGGYCLNGPFEASLSVTDSNGFQTNSTSVVIGQDSGMTPAALVTASPSTISCPTATLTVVVTDPFGGGVGGAVVIVSHTGTTNANSYYTMGTDGMKTIHIACSGPGTITLNVNSLPAVNVPFS